ncbi:MAG: hypothetical protein L0Y57_11690, partial [Beijerinckiaceae bacterium]|nr:hypothetical protein [Beijerinckiaceae bacterium]
MRAGNNMLRDFYEYCDAFRSQPHTNRWGAGCTSGTDVILNRPAQSPGAGMRNGFRLAFFACLVIDTAKTCHYVLQHWHMFRNYSRIGVLNAALICSAGTALAAAVAPEEPVACPEGMVCPEGSKTSGDPADTSSEGPKCQAAQRAIADKGFSEIRKVECSGRYFVFTAWRLETIYII